MASSQSIVGIAFGVTGLFFYSAGVFLKPISAEFGWTRTALSSVNLIAALTLAGTAPLIGWLGRPIHSRQLPVALAEHVTLACQMSCWSQDIQQGSDLTNDCTSTAISSR